MLREAFTMCKGLVVAHLQLRDLPYNGAVMNEVTEHLPFVTVAWAFRISKDRKILLSALGHFSQVKVLSLTESLRRDI